MNILILSLIASLVVTIILGIILLPRLRKLKIGQVVREDGPKEHLKKTGTPTMGGIIMLAPIIVILAINSISYPILVLPIIAILGFGLVGFIDDYRKIKRQTTEGLSPMKKIIGLTIVTVIFLFVYLVVFRLDTTILIPLINQPLHLSIPVFIAFTTFIMLGTSNAVNLTDGLDGLATGVVAIIMTFFTVVSYQTGDMDMCLLGVTTVGTCLGFLVFNAYPAKMFMGDVGSFALGGAIVSIAIILKMPLYLAIVAIICILETITVILQIVYFKLTKGKRLFKMAPLHHHLELSGIKENVVCISFWTVTILACLVAFYV